MKQEQFESRYREVWQQFEQVLGELEKGRSKASAEAVAQFPGLYRRVCNFLALAQERCYSTYLVEHLNELVLRGHQQLYRFSGNIRRRIIRYLVSDFPRLVREQGMFITVGLLLVFVPALVFFLLILVDPYLVFSFLEPAQVTQFEQMYDPGQEQIGRNRESDTDFMMFGYYIYNNISVAFRSFAGGLLFMAGSVLALVFNGLLLGAVAGHLTHLGYTETFFTFVIGHGAFELTAIGIAGGAGLRLGYSLIAPGRLSRLESLKQAARIGVRLMYGVILMLLIAAFLEAFWSSNGSVSASLKYGVGAGLWLLVVLYLSLAGRSKPDERGSSGVVGSRVGWSGET